MRISEILAEAKAVKQRLDAKCWKGKHKEGTKIKGGVRVNNCVPNESVTKGFGRDDDDYHLLDVGPTRWYRFKDGRFFTFNVYPGGEKQAERDGYSRTQAEARQKSDQGTDEQGVAEGSEEKSLQKTIDFAAKRGFQIKTSPKRTRATFVNNKLNYTVKAILYRQNGELWVNWVMDRMSGNDPIDEFYQEFVEAYKEAVVDAKEQAKWDKWVAGGAKDEFHEEQGVAEGLDQARVSPETLQVVQQLRKQMSAHTTLQAKKTMLVIKSDQLGPQDQKLVQDTLTQAGIPFKIKDNRVEAVRGSYTNTLIGIPYDQQGVAEDFDAQFDVIEEMVEAFAQHHGVDADVIWEDFESVDDLELLDESAAWRRKEGKSKKGGLNAKGVASYRRENPGSKLQTAVTTKPSKLKPGSKAAKRRKSFCARMGGVKGPMKKPNGKPTRKALALRKWNC